MLIFAVVNGVLEVATDEFARALGFDNASQIVGLNFEHLVWPEDRLQFAAALKGRPKKVKANMRHTSGRKSVAMVLNFSETSQLVRNGEVLPTFIGIANRKGAFPEDRTESDPSASSVQKGETRRYAARKSTRAQSSEEE